MKLILVVMLIVLVFPLHAATQTHQNSSVKSYRVFLNEAHQHFQNKEYQQALDLYLQSYQAEPLDSTLYNIAICHYKLKQWQAALTIFTQLQPDINEADLISYNTAVVYKKLGNRQKALQIFQVINKNSRDKNLAQLSSMQIEKLTTLSAKPQQTPPQDSLWYGSINIGYGMDDNVDAPDDETNTKTSDNYIETLALLSWRNNLQSRNYWTVNFIYYGTHYQQVQEYDVSLLRFGGKKFFSLPVSSKILPYLAADYEKLTLGGDNYLSNIRFVVGTDVYIKNKSKISAQLQFKQINEDNRDYTYLAGRSNQFDINWIQGDTSSRWKLGLRYIADRRNDISTETSFTSYSANRYALIAGKSWSLTDWNFHLNTNYRISNYQDANIVDNQSTAKRRDKRLYLSADTEYEINRNWSLTGEISWSNNQSNIDSYVYDQTLLLGGFSYQF